MKLKIQDLALSLLLLSGCRTATGSTALTVSLDANGVLLAPLNFFQANLFATNAVPSGAAYTSSTYTLTLTAGKLYYFQSTAGDQATLNNGSQTIAWPSNATFVASGGTISLMTGNGAGSVSSVVLGQVGTNYGKFVGDHVGNFSGNANGVSNVPLGSATGTLPAGGLSGTYSNAVALTNTGNSFAGSGAGVSNVPLASATGTLPAGALSGTYGNTVSLTNTGNHFTGNGAGITGLLAGAGPFVPYIAGTLNQQVTGAYHLMDANFNDRFFFNNVADNFYDANGNLAIAIDTAITVLNMNNLTAPNQVLNGSSSVLTLGLANGLYLSANGNAAGLTNANPATLFSTTIPPSVLGGGSTASGAILSRSGWVVVSGSGTVTSIALQGDGVSTATTPSGSPITTSGTITMLAANASANTFVRGPTSGSAAPLAQGPIVSADLTGLFTPQSFGTWTPHDNLTNFWLDFGSVDYPTIAGTGDVHFTLGTNGPHAISITILANADGTVRNILWPTNMITLNTNGLTVVGTNYLMSLTNNGNYRVAQCSFLTRFNNPPNTNIIGMCVISP